MCVGKLTDVPAGGAVAISMAPGPVALAAVFVPAAGEEKESGDHNFLAMGCHVTVQETLRLHL